MKKILSLLFLALLCVGGWADDWTVSLPEHSIVSVSETAESAFEVSTSADDNSHWYVLQQKRDGLTPVVDMGGANYKKNLRQCQQRNYKWVYPYK